MPAVTLYTVVTVCSFARYLRRARRHVCAFLLLFLRLSLFLLRPDRAARSIAMSVSVSVLVCPGSYLRNYTSFTKFVVHVTYDRGLGPPLAEC